MYIKFFQGSKMQKRITLLTVFVFSITIVGLYLQQVHAQAEDTSAIPGDTTITQFNLQVNANSEKVQLTWTQLSISDIAKYQYKRNDDAWTDIPNSDSSTVTYTVTDPIPGQLHTFAVRAVNAADTTLAESNSVSVVPGRITSGINGLSLNERVDMGAAAAFSPDGNTLYVGATGYNTNNIGRGAVHSFTKNADDIWMYQETIGNGSHGLVLSVYDEFGSSIAISSDGNTLFVGAVGDDTGGKNKGAVHVFGKNNTGGWSHTEKIAHGTGGLTIVSQADSNAGGSAYFGSSIAVSPSGNTLFVGAKGDNVFSLKENKNTQDQNAAVYILTKNGSGEWTHSDTIADETHGADLHHFSRFGSSVAISPDGETLFVGASRNATDGDPTGSVYFFRKREENWMYAGVIEDIADDSDESSFLIDYDNFGRSLAISPDGDVLYVGADADEERSRGSVYAFVKNGDKWTLKEKLGHDNGAGTLGNYSYFGVSVAVSPDGETVVVGARGDSTDGVKKGGVHVFSQSEGLWVHDETLEHDRDTFSLTNRAEFGGAAVVTADGNTLLIGAPLHYGDGIVTSGAVIIFKKVAGAWVYDKTLENGVAGLALHRDSNFGWALDLSADENTLYVGTSGSKADSDTALTARGAVYILTKDDDGEWQYSDKIQSGTTNNLALDIDDRFGHSVKISNDGNTLFVGAATDDFLQNSNSGSIYVLTKNTDGVWKGEKKIAHVGALDRFGFSIEASNDGNTLYVGAPRESGGNVDESGMVQIFTKDDEGAWKLQEKIGHGSHGLVLSPTDLFGFSIRLSQDENTLFVGAGGDDSGGTDKGAVHIFSKQENGRWLHADKIKDGVGGVSLLRNARLGSALEVSSGDQDMLYIYVGARNDFSIRDRQYTGALYIFNKDDEGDWVFHTRIAHDNSGLSLGSTSNFGSAVAFSADGSTFFVGAPGELHENHEDRGVVYGFRKGEDGYLAHAEKFESDEIDGFHLIEHELFGSALALSSDGEVLYAGAPGRHSDGGGRDLGGVYIFARDDDGTWELEDTIWGVSHGIPLWHDDNFGTAIALSHPDEDTLFVGSPGDDTGGTDRGAVHVFTKDDEGAWDHDETIEHDTHGLELSDSDRFGSSLHLSSDGATLFVGAHLHDHADGEDRGAVHIFTKNSDDEWAHSETIGHDTHGLSLNDEDHFGKGLTLSRDGTTLFVGAHLDDHANGEDRGAVHVFARKGNAWAHDLTLEHDAEGDDHGLSLDSRDRFGYAVTLSPDGILYVGAHGHDHIGGMDNADTGGVHAFRYVDGVRWAY